MVLRPRCGEWSVGCRVRFVNVLGCDLGGTHARLRVARCGASACPQTIVERYFRSADYPGLEPVMTEFFAAHRLDPADIAYTCVAVAGPVHNLGAEQRCQLTNLPWVVDSGALTAALGLARVELINDFEAIGYGLDALPSDGLLTLQVGEPLARAPRALIGAGTGLGQALLVWENDGYRVIATEGGHVDFAPTDDVQVALLQHLRAQMGRVSYEDVLSGPGLERIFHFLQTESEQPGEPLLVPADEPELAAAIGRAAVEKEHVLAAAAVTLFVDIYGAQAGNLALTAMARGGVFIAGGIAPKLGALLASERFLQSFRAKGRMTHLMPKFPLHLVRQTDAGLAGATRLSCQRVARLAAQS